MKILCVNCGSSSLKFQLMEMPEEKLIISGLFEKIGLKDSSWTIKMNGKKFETEGEIRNHTDATSVLLKELIKHKAIKSLNDIDGVGHRIVHGAEKYNKSVIITDEVINDIIKFTKFAPLHHPGNLAGVEALRSELPNTPMVAVYDTAFHQTMPKKNYMYPVPYEWYKKYGVRKYGFHGTSHKYLTEAMKKKLGKENVNLIICHIGSGASLCAVKNGKSYDTTMGLTPLDGLMMGTRSGSIDASILEYVEKESGYNTNTITNALNKKSGFVGISGYSDSRDVEKSAEKGDAKAKLAIDMFNSRVANYIADYYIELGGKVDAIVFSAGMGENAIDFREDIVNRLKPLGLKIDSKVNKETAGYKDQSEAKISADDSSIDIYVLPTNEELMIIRDTYELCK